MPISGPGTPAEHQRFDVTYINRQEITPAPYNPRIMRPENAKLLRKSMKAFGLVEPLVWNKRSGHLVGGHQRLSVLDELEKTQDYQLVVSVVDLDDREERNLNMALNNTNLQGDWDEQALGELLKDCSKEDYDAIGVTRADLDILLGEVGDVGTLYRDAPEAEQTKEALAEIKEDRAAMTERLAEEQRVDFYAVILFETPQERETFYQALGFNVADQYLRGVDVIRAAGLEFETAES